MRWSLDGDLVPYRSARRRRSTMLRGLRGNRLGCSRSTTPATENYRYSEAWQRSKWKAVSQLAVTRQNIRARRGGVRHIRSVYLTYTVRADQSRDPKRMRSGAAVSRECCLFCNPHGTLTKGFTLNTLGLPDVYSVSCYYFILLDSVGVILQWRSTE
ncbi:hypothetical protein BC628DRAFT_952355 [Trametes gibbosa]|nr:hypothetical protein BC628DRAFT_952355 [Trametes gibbosa]